MESLLDIVLQDQQFREAYEAGKQKGLIEPFDDDFFETMRTVKWIWDKTLFDYFSEGLHIGHCGRTIDKISGLFNEYKIFTGKLPAIKGTKESPDGEHAWIVSEGMLYDTSLLIRIDDRISSSLGYSIEKEYEQKAEDRER